MSRIIHQLRSWWDEVDERMILYMTIHGINFIRITLAIVFIWFGMLKVLNRSPDDALLAETVFWIPPELFIPVLGVFETLIGLGLLFSKVIRLMLLLCWVGLICSFLAFIIKPEVMFYDHNPLLLTLEGELVIKNLVLIAGGLVVGSAVRRTRRP